MKTYRMSCKSLVPAIMFCAVAAGASAHAQNYLVGAYLFGANSDGSTNSVFYQYDTDDDAATPLSVNGLGNHIAIPLSVGVNNFTFGQDLHDPAGSFATLGLFFSSDPVPYDPGAPARDPDLAVSNATDSGSGFFIPASGTTLNNYFYNVGADISAANGLSSLSIGANTISVSDYTVIPDPSGTFAITESAPGSTPEPGLFGLVSGLSTFGLLMKARRRRK